MLRWPFRRVFALGLVPLLVAAAPQAPADEPLRLLTNDNPPFSIVHGDRVGGLSVDVLKEMSARAEVPLTLEAYPWVRAYDEAQNRTDTCVFSAARLPDRELLFSWVGPLATNSWALFGRSDFPGTLNSLEEARRYVIGGETEEAKTVYLIARGFDIDRLPNDNLNPQRLVQGRIDLWVSGLQTAPAKAAEVGITAIKPVLVFRQEPIYLACNPAVPARTIRQLQAALDAMRADGKLAAITRRYQDPAGAPVD
ncbi:MAG: transporter substrate-binding domain-containing protein [Aliidongia sp.]